jgi:hypothetical protein
VRAVANHHLKQFHLKFDLNQQLPSEYEAYVQPQFCALVQNIVRFAYNNDDSLLINDPSFMGGLITDTILNSAAAADIPVAVVKLHRSRDDDAIAHHSAINDMIDAMISAQCAQLANDDNRERTMIPMQFVKLYQYRLKLTPSMLAYLTRQQRANLILYDSDYQLLAVGVYSGDYVHHYSEHYDTVTNPYRYQSLVEFHALLSMFGDICRERLMSLISVFNHSLRACLDFVGGSCLWSAVISEPAIFAKLLRTIEQSFVFDPVAQCYECDSDGDSNSSQISMSTTECVDEEITCAICFDFIDKHQTAHCHNHSDICVECAQLWKVSSESNTCPKCGVLLFCD